MVIMIAFMGVLRTVTLVLLLLSTTVSDDEAVNEILVLIKLAAATSLDNRGLMSAIGEDDTGVKDNSERKRRKAG